MTLILVSFLKFFTAAFTRITFSAPVSYTHLDGNIVVRMLESVREHVLEGKAMHHCVGSGTNYSLNPDCIIFSARIAEQRVETVEFSLEQMKVVQCHGLQNKDTEHHADIINLVNSNARLIEQRMVATT